MKSNQDDIEPDAETTISSKTKKDDPKCENNHARDDRVATGHEIEPHEIGRHHRGEIEQLDADDGQTQALDKGYPWTAPRVMLDFLEWDIGMDEPTTWSLDNYDGEEIWQEIGKAPNNEYRHDVQVTTSQYHKMVNTLHNWENEIDELIKQWRTTMNDDWRVGEWERIKACVKEVCMNIYQEAESSRIQRVNETNMKTIGKPWSHELQAYSEKE